MSFNLDDFMNQTVDAAMDTTYPVHPEGEFLFMVDTDPDMLKVKHVSGTGDKGPYDFHQIELVCVSQDEKVKHDMGRDKVTCVARVNLDFDITGALASGPGKNVLLGQFREAFDQNKPGWSPKQLLGQGPFIGRVKQRDATDGSGRKFANIVSVTKRI